MTNLDQGKELTYAPKLITNGVYAFVIEGDAEINGKLLGRRDALGISETNEIKIKAHTDSEILLIDVPMLF